MRLFLDDVLESLDSSTLPLLDEQFLSQLSMDNYYYNIIDQFQALALFQLMCMQIFFKQGNSGIQITVM